MHHPENTKHQQSDTSHGAGPAASWPFRLDQKLTDEEINSLNTEIFKGPIELVRTSRELDIAVDELKNETLLGFDTEKRPSFKKGVAYPPSLIQLCGYHKAYLFQLTFLKLSRSLTDILANPKIIKAGVAIGRDVKELRDLSEFQPNGFVDLGIWAAHCGIQHHGLRGLAALLLGCRISKRAKLTNWSKPSLPPFALQYAATDAWIGRRIYEAMEEKDCFKNPLPPPSPPKPKKNRQTEFSFGRSAKPRTAAEG